MNRALKHKAPAAMGRPPAKVGDFVLIGTPRSTVWYRWWLAEVLWIGAEEVLVEQYGIAGQHTHRQIHPLDYIRAVGTADEVMDLKRRIGRELEPLLRDLGQAENAVSEANAAIFCKLDEFAAAEPMRNADAGATEFEIMAFLGHKTPAEARTYTKKANRRVLADSGMGKLARAKREQALSNL